MKTYEIFWNDLTPDAQSRLSDLYDFNMDIYPIHTIEKEDNDELIPEPNYEISEPNYGYNNSFKHRTKKVELFSNETLVEHNQDIQSFLDEKSKIKILSYNSNIAVVDGRNLRYITSILFEE